MAIACEDAPLDHDAALALDLSLADWVIADATELTDAAPDADPPPPDAAMAVRGTVCGDQLCYVEAEQYCHTTDWGASGLCVMRSTPSPGYYGCDGPEDCMSGACCLLDSASVCGALGFCVDGTTVGEFMCHTDVECGQMSRCCPKGSTGSYHACADGLQPTDPCPSVP